MKPRLDPRVFLALPITRTVRGWLEEIQGELKKYLEDWYFVPPANFHVTLRFFGEVPEETITRIETACRNVAENLPPLSLHWNSLDYFGPPQAGRVLFVDAKETDELNHFVKAIMAHFPEGEQRKKFRPHITLCKARQNMQPDAVERNSNMLRRLRELGRIGPEKMDVNFNSFHRDFVLMETIWVGRAVEYFPRARFEMTKEI